MTRAFALLLAPAVALLPALAVATEWVVDPAGSTLSFSGTYQGESFGGKFERFDASITLDAADPAAGRIDVVVDVASATTGTQEIDAQLPAAEFFNSSKFPKAKFSSSAVHDGDGGLVADGTLTIRDKTRPVALKLRFAPTAAGATLDADASVKRLAFDVGSGEWADTSVIGDDVAVKAHLVLKRKPGG
jgi:polyisoprenoid-binding protein YceI